ncbi:TonB-dependent receptor [Aureibaculum marinum]|uniref:TonB-dependent receptor n=1 Tax=Aureibaculum marinum TaxID=2487930 RepID=A0A3N4NRH8_9FLAO|nr:TonB-dependent receptor [Aureibaculum marinum]RPD98834.1 TonB-dependent receptor [Aureibaculum marinum]
MKNKLHFMLSLILVLAVQLTYAQKKTVTGTVTDDSGPLPGVSILIKGTSMGTETDFDGNYSIQVNTGDILVFSFVGMATQEKTVGSSNTIDVVLTADNLLDEVMVVAYGTTKKSDFTGSAAQINSDDLAKITMSNPTSAIEGSAAGVTATFGSGQPGSGQNIRIRGFGSFSASSSPLYVVDGVPFTGSINSINPNDIESLTILKDASSTALYGNKAANGVVMITTKKGKNRKGEFSLNVSASIVDRSIPEYDRLGPDQYYEIMWEALRNGEAIPGIDDPADVTAANLYATNNIYDELKNNPYNVPNDQIVGIDGKINPSASLLYPDDLDWEDAITRKGFRQNYDMSYQGGTEKSDFYASLGYLKEEGYILNSDFERISGRVNVNHQATKWLKTGLNVGISNSAGNQAQATSAQTSSFVNPIRFTRGIGPIYNIHKHDASGNYILDDNGNKIYDLDAKRASGASDGRHIAAEIDFNEDLDEITSINAKSYVDITLTDGLVFTVNASFDQRHYYNTDFENKYVGDGAPGGRAGRTYERRTAVGFNQLLNYSKTFNDKHNFKALLAHESLDYKIDYLDGSRQQQIVDGNSELINFVTTLSLTSILDTRTDESYFGRLNYDYDGKYFLSASYRQDGSSKFSKDTRWGDFWSIGAAWRLDQESFIQDLDWINALKLRASYGELGNNSGISFYAYQGLYDLGYNNQSEPGILQAGLAASNLQWEASESSDVALEFRLFDNRLDGVIEYYNRNSDNLLFDVPLPLSSGSTSIPQNIGSMYNRGIEVSLNYDVIKTENFNWNFGINATTIKNEFTKLPQEEIINGSKKLMVGRSIYDYWLRDWYGVDPADGEILYVAEEGASGSSVREIDGMTLTTDDAQARYHYAGTAIPDLMGSINNNLSYKAFNLSFLLTYQIGGEILDSNYQGLMSSGTYGSALSVDILDRWQQPGDITDVPRMDPSNTTDFNATSDRWLTDASYLNLKRANLSYNLPESVLSSIGVSNALIYVSGENLFSVNARKGLTIQQNFNGTVNNVYTPSRIVSIGLNVKF